MMKKFSIIVLMLVFPFVIQAEMVSDSFKIKSDVIGAFGAPGTSDSFNINDTGGEVGTGLSDSTSFNLKAGFWQMAVSYSISIDCYNAGSSSGDHAVTMGSITGDGQSSLATNSANCNIITDNPNGYSLNWKSSAASMAGTADPLNTISAYSPAASDTPENWSVAVADSEWGGHLGSTSTTPDTATWGTDDDYGSGANWLNIGTSDYEIISRSDRTSVSGDDEIIWFGAEVGSSKIQPSDTYTVTVTMTAIAL